MTTIEYINSKLNEKINMTRDLVAQTIINSFDKIVFDKIIDEYEFGSIQILSEYYFLNCDSADYLKKKAEIFTEYTRFIIRIGILPQLDKMIEKLKSVDNAHAKKLMECKNIKLKLSVKKTNGSLCEFCNEQMVFLAKESILECPKCFAQITAKGMMLLEDRDDITDRSHKKSQHQSRKHGKEWLDSLQGLENKDVPKHVVDHVLSCMRKDRIIDKTQLTCDNIRSYLSRSPKTAKFNQQIPKIRKLITGIEPPQLTYSETELFLEYYGRVMKIDNEKKTKTNCLYCPYYIRKILEQILKAPEDRVRRDRFFSYIHLQLSDTLIEQDNIWAQICEEIPEFEYWPTIRNL
jgi:ribosomal protein L37AE/L43A